MNTSRYIKSSLLFLLLALLILSPIFSKDSKNEEKEKPHKLYVDGGYRYSALHDDVAENTYNIGITYKLGKKINAGFETGYSFLKDTETETTINQSIPLALTFQFLSGKWSYLYVSGGKGINTSPKAELGATTIDFGVGYDCIKRSKNIRFHFQVGMTNKLMGDDLNYGFTVAGKLGILM